MKKTRKRLLSFLAACMIACLPAAQALAASCDAEMLEPSTVLFPGDTLFNAQAVTLDGEAAELSEGAWVNESKGKAYSASRLEDGTVELTFAGYVLSVKNGTSYAEAGGHQEYLEEDSEYEDVAYYPADTVVYLTADAPEDGMMFSGWTSNQEEDIFEDASSSETTVTMIQKKVVVAANYEPVPAPEPEPETEPAPVPEPVTEPEQQPETQPVAEPEQQPETQPVTEPEQQPETPLAAETEPETPLVIEIEPETQPVTEPEQQPETPLAAETEPETLFVIETEPETQPMSETEPGFTDGGGSQGGEPDIPIIDITTSDEYGTDSGNGPESEAVQEILIPEVNSVTVNVGDGSGSFEAGSTVEIAAADLSAEGYEFTSWSVDTMNVELNDLYAPETAFTMPEGEVVLTAHYMDAMSGEPVAAPLEAGANADPAQTDAPETGSGQTEMTTEAPLPAQTEMTTEAPLAAQSEQQTEPEETEPEETEPAVYSLTVTNGTIAEDEAKFYEAGEEITLTADEPEEGMQFSRWTGKLTDTEALIADTAFSDVNAETAVFTMPAANVTVEAEYKPVTYTVKVSNGLINDTATEMTVEKDTVVSITANENPTGQIFSMWRVDDEDYDLGDYAYNSTINVAVTQDLSFAAEYEGVEYNILVNDGTADYEDAVSGTLVTITADAAPEGMEFDYWKVDTGNVSLGDAYSATTTFTVPMADVEISAYFRMKKYYVTVQNGYTDDDFYYMGQEVTVYSNYPASGKEFDQWQKVSGNVSFGDASRWKTTFTMPASDVTVNAAYKDGPSPDNNQILEIAAGGEYITDTTIRFTAAGAGMENSNPNPGDYRYRPSGYQIGNVTGTWQASPYTTSMSIKAAGEYTLKTIYAKDVFDGNSWVPDGTSDTKSVTFRVVTPAAAVATGDETPILMTAALACASCLLFILLLVTAIRRRKNI